MPVFQASGAQRGTSKDMDAAWQAETENRGDGEGKQERRKNAALQQRDAALQTAVKYELQQRVAACTAQPAWLSDETRSAHPSPGLPFFSTVKSVPTAWHAPER